MSHASQIFKSSQTSGDSNDSVGYIDMLCMCTDTIIKLLLVRMMLFSCQTHTWSTEIGRAHHNDNVFTPVCELSLMERRFSEWWLNESSLSLGTHWEARVSWMGESILYRQRSQLTAGRLPVGTQTISKHSVVLRHWLSRITNDIVCLVPEPGLEYLSIVIFKCIFQKFLHVSQQIQVTIQQVKISRLKVR